MEAQLQPLIDTIKAEGIEAAETRAAEIVAAADARAAKIVEEATRKAAEQLESSKREVERLETAGQHALQQAARDLMLAVERQLQDKLDRLVRDHVGEALSGDSLATVIEQLATNWRVDGDANLEVLISEENRERLESGSLAQLRDQLRDNVTLRPSPEVDAGIRIGLENGNVRYDFTAGGIAEMLSQYLSPRLAALMRG
jgi:V/A-type H+-transporting ATPase subunit E